MSQPIQIGLLRLEFLLSKHETAGSLDMFRMVVPPTGNMPVAHYHRDWDETVHGLEGTVTFTLEGTPHPIGPGETLFIRRGVVHGFDNPSGADATCLVVLTPGALGPEYFQEMAALVGKGKPDPQAIGAVMARYGLVPTPT